MNLIALKMLVGDRAKYFGIVMGLTFASLLITQQAGIFTGLMSRTYGAIEDLGQPDVWVMEPKVQFIDDVKPLLDTQVDRIRGIPGVQWAVPLYKGLIKARLNNGNFQTCIVMGLDDATLVGGPPIMIQGQLSDLWQSDGVIVDEYGAKDKLIQKRRDGTIGPVQVGDQMELNDHFVRVVGICKNSRTFQSQPVVYTTYTRATTFAPRERKMLSFVLVKAAPRVDLADLCDRIAAATKLAAYTKAGFEKLTYDYFMKYTGIPINFGIAVGLGFLVGTAIAGQTFYNFTLDNLRHFGALKAMGASNVQLLEMILVQSLLVGAMGYGLGVGVACAMGWTLRNTELSFRLPGWLLFANAGAVLVICAASAMISIFKVIRLEPAVVFK